MDEEPTDLETSRGLTGRRFYHCHPAAYQAISDSVDEARHFPAGVGTKAPTERSLPLTKDVKKDGNGWLLLSIEVNRIGESDDVLLSGAVEQGYLKELTENEFKAIR